MERELQERKLARYFAGLDSDGNGVLEESDLAAAARRTARAFGYADDAPEAQPLREACLGFWRELIAPMDADGDGGVTPAEMLAAFRRQLSGDPADYAAQIGPTAELFFRMGDADQDGWIDAAEWEQLFSASARVPAEEAREAFRRVDHAGSGRVSRAQFHQAMTEFFYGGDPAAPGTIIFGRL